ncbi:MAG TPA: ANTAR domain-containing protein [Candidatus Binatia bacterium]|jgi:response regulator NasT
MRRVLVIDDHESSRKQLITILRDGGYEIAGEETSGKLAPVLARAAVPDVILMAVGLPDIDGIEAARDVMQSQPVPIVLITSHCDTATVERAKMAGIMGYLVKPLRAPEVSPAIELAITRFQDFVSLRAENSSLKENLEARKLIERAKGLLMSQRNLTEEQAYTLIKKTSMNMRKPMADVAQAIILAGGIFKGDKH